MTKSADIPSELRSYQWLKLLGSTRFIVLLYNSKGEPLWAANRVSHAHEALITRYMEAPLFEFFDTERRSDLNDIFSNHISPSPHINAQENHLELLENEGLPLTAFPAFNSKNRMESSILCPTFVLKQPLAIMALLRLNRGRFIGIIMLRPLSYLFALSEKRNVLLADTDDRIIGCTSLFAKPLNLRDNSEILGRSVSEVLRFSRPPFGQPETSPAEELKPVFSWSADENRFPFEKINVSPERVIHEKGAWQWSQSETGDYGYLKWNAPFPIDQTAFCVNVDFIASGRKIPNLILRGTEWTAGVHPDDSGYSFGNTMADPGCRFKKETQHVKFFQLPELIAGRRYTLSILRRADRFTFRLDDHIIGQWNDTHPFLKPGPAALYLFLRPGETLTLIALRGSSLPETAVTSVPPPALTAEYVRPDVNIQYAALVEETTLDNDNCLLYQFEDITSFVDDIRSLKSERDALSGLLQNKSPFMGQSPALLEIRNDLKRVADKPITVLIEGETGTGKEVLAQTIHRESPRANKPFVKIDCSTLPAALIESELFGHEKGSFTGAHASHPGRFEQANGGTVFLDEVANLPPEVQRKLLGVLQDKTVSRIGSTKPVKLNFRLIAASNVPLRLLVEKGLFRSDLYYRLNTFLFNLPPLRERKEDIPLLADHFLHESNALYGKTLSGFSREALAKLVGHGWPGNVRELRNCIMQAVVLADGPRINEQDIRIETGSRTPVPGRSSSTGSRAPRKRILSNDLTEALKSWSGHVSETARHLGISRAMIYILLHKFKISPADYRTRT